MTLFRFFLFVTVSLCSPNWPTTYHVDQAGSLSQRSSSLYLRVSEPLCLAKYSVCVRQDREAGPRQKGAAYRDVQAAGEQVVFHGSKAKPRATVAANRALAMG